MLPSRKMGGQVDFCGNAREPATSEKPTFMGVLIDMIEALRRLGSVAQKAALRRQDKYLENKTVINRRREGGSFVATVAPIPETVVPLSDEELRPILANAELIGQFLSAFGAGRQPWSLEDLDLAFAAWSQAGDRRGYSNEAVIEITGAAYGQYCIERLDMRWVKVTDADGTAVALQGTKKDFRAFPYHSVSKRIDDSEMSFFGTIYASLAAASEKDWKPIGVT